MQPTAQTIAPAKLNLFLELIAKRPDGYHEIDTVMVPINWTDSLLVQRTDRCGVQLKLQWLPSEAILADRLGVAHDTEARSRLLDIPVDTRNLVCRALERFLRVTELPGGFDCHLLKQIPAGAGMGGASSNAASALMAAASLVEQARRADEPSLDSVIDELAADLGSDVNFFLGRENLLPQSAAEAPQVHREFRAARGTGRGEQIAPIAVNTTFHLVAVFPGTMLSTPRVYANSKIPEQPISACELIQALRSQHRGEVFRRGFNRLVEPAVMIEPKVKKTLHVMQHSGLRACQMTGSGSACFGFALSARHARRIQIKLTAQLRPGAIVRACRTIRVPLGAVLR